MTVNNRQAYQMQISMLAALPADGRQGSAAQAMYGKKYMGVDRSTFLVGPDGKVAKLWRKVAVPGHVEEVLAAAQGVGRGG